MWQISGESRANLSEDLIGLKTHSQSHGARQRVAKTSPGLDSAGLAVSHPGYADCDEWRWGVGICRHH